MALDVAPVVAGLFVGGRGVRLGGVAKGNLDAPDGGTLVDRSLRLLEGLGIPVVLVGPSRGIRPDQGSHTIACEDEPPGIGPLGGLIALLRHAGDSRVLALACDMPFVSTKLLVRELLAFDPRARPSSRPAASGIWEPSAPCTPRPRVLPIAAVARAALGARSLQGLLDGAGRDRAAASMRPATSSSRDWDTPEDLGRETKRIEQEDAKTGRTDFAGGSSRLRVFL